MLDNRLRLLLGRLTFLSQVVAVIALSAIGSQAVVAANPSLPASDGTVSIETQPWPQKPGPRKVKIYLHYPGGAIENVDKNTGLMLSLHNWGGKGFSGTADPKLLAQRYNVVAIGVDYLQSGQRHQEHPYDFGFLQAIDALRALHFVFAGLDMLEKPFARGRIFATGGSGGGNVTLMVNKFAPRTFACVIDLSGMAKLNNDVAFHLPGGSRLDARYSRIPGNPAYLSPDAKQIRFVGDRQHLGTMKRLGNRCTVIVVHGSGDDVCPVADVREMVANMRAAGLEVEPHIITANDLDGETFKNIGHGVGDRTRIVLRVADKYLLPNSPPSLSRKGRSDFEFRDGKVRYETVNGRFVVSYESGFPSIVFHTQ